MNAPDVPCWLRPGVSKTTNPPGTERVAGQQGVHVAALFKAFGPHVAADDTVTEAGVAKRKSTFPVILHPVVLM